MAMNPTDHGELHTQAELYVLGALTASERTTFEAHLRECSECQASVHSLSTVANALAQAVPQHDPPPALRARILAAVGASPATIASRPARVTPSFIPWLAAAASLAAAVALGAYAASLRTRVGTLEQRLREATVRAEVNDRQLAELRRTSAEAQSQVAVLAAPDLRRIDLAGQPAAARASGRAFWSRSRGLVFTASNLPALPPGRTYQLWVLTSGPAPISAGVFKPDPDGRVIAMFGTPSDLPNPVGMAVTIEPDGGVPAPTGDKYLVSL